MSSNATSLDKDKKQALSLRVTNEKVLGAPELHQDEEPTVPSLVDKSMSAGEKDKRTLQKPEVHRDASTIPSIEEARRNEGDAKLSKEKHNIVEIAGGNADGDSEPTVSLVIPPLLALQDGLDTNINEATVPGAVSIDGIDSRPSAEGEIDPTDPPSVQDAPPVPDEGSSEILITADVVESEPKLPVYNAEQVRCPSRNWMIGLAVAACLVTAIVVPTALLVARSNASTSSGTSPSASPTTSTPSLRSSNIPSMHPSMAPTPLSDLILDMLVSKSLDGGTTLLTDGTDQNKAYQWLVTNKGLPAYSVQQIMQRYVLAAFFFATGGDGWYSNDGWLSSEDECTSWFPTGDSSGFPVCDSSGRVANLDLSGLNLQGTLPLELSLLSDSLSRIFLLNNGLTGTLPSAIGMLSKLEAVNLRANFFSGIVPTETSLWNSISIIDVNDNDFYGQLPLHSWSQLEIYDVGDNHFSGSVPSVIGNSTLLRRVILDRNILTGPLPTVLGNLQQLTDLSIQNNKFSSLPSELGRLSILRDLDVTNSSVGASLPVEWFSLTNLEEFLASSNSAVGIIPTTIGLLTKLQLLHLQSNDLVGTIPSEIGLLGGNTRLNEILLNNNDFGSQLPSEMGLLRAYRRLSLETNSFIGSIPASVCDYVNESYSNLRADCEELDCPCCLYCCIDGAEDCVCTVEGELSGALC